MSLTKTAKKKVLIITYNFPPMGGGGVIRTLKFCKYLPSFDWMPVVLTVKKHDTDIIDKSLFKEIPDTKIFTTFSIDWPLIYKRLYRKCKRVNVTEEYNDGNNHNSKKANLVRSFINNFIFIPDSRVGWIPFAIISAIKICKNENIDIIFSTGGPWTNHIIGLLLKTLTKLPWVADFRDSWTTNPFSIYSNKVRKIIDEKLENLVLVKSDKIVTTTSSIKIELKNKHQEIKNDKFSIIRNGFDKADFIGVKKKTNIGFNILHAGNFYSKRTPDFFLLALKDFLDENILFNSNFAVNFIGTVNDKTRKIINKLELDKIVQCSGSVPHNESIKLMVEADLLLLIVGTEKSECPGKIYEYLAARTPILSLSGHGEVSNILSQFIHVKIVNSKDISQIKTSIKDFYMEKYSDRLNIESHQHMIQKFDREELTKRLSLIFCQLI